MSNFQQASSFVIENLNQTDVRVDIEQQKQKAFERLLGEIVQGASHDAEERFDAPACHPETRTAVLDDIKSWVNDDNESTRIMWLNGPAGAGKSAIAQTTADDFHSEGKLVASFFFSRFAAGRNMKNGLIPTIAFQLSVSIPEIKEHIINAIVKNPNIFKSNIKTQFQTLVVDPYSHLSEAENGTTTRPRVIIIDGLDECENSDHQAEIINALGTSLKKKCTSRLRILIASRPEPRIRQTFDDEVISTISTRLTLDDKYDPDEDIELFLRSSLQALKRHHVLAPILKSWPPESSIQHIVYKSSGQFIYAATVVKYISDPQQHPIKRLDIVLNMEDADGEQPFTQLDALYTAILSNIRRDYKKVALIFKAIMYHANRYICDLSASFLDDFLNFENETPLILADLSSIVYTKMEFVPGLRFYHASFSDYLQDPSRSQDFYIDEHQSHAHLAICCANWIADHPPGSEVVSQYPAHAIFDHYKFSNYDDSVLESILSNGLFADDGVNSLYRKWYHLEPEECEVEYNTLLGRLVYDTPIREEAKDSLRNAIDSAFRNHLRRYDPHHILIIYYFAPWLGYYRVNQALRLVPALKDEIYKPNILFDSFSLCVRSWLILLIQDDLVHVSQEARLKSACYVLEVLLGTALRDNCHISEDARETCHFIYSEPESHKKEMIKIKYKGLEPFKDLRTFLHNICDLLDNLPDTIEVSTAIFQKWKSINPTAEQLAKSSDDGKFRYRVLDDIIQAYLKRTLKHDVVGVQIQTDTDELHLSTATDNLVKDIPNTGNYTPLNKFLILLISIQFLLISYMYMRLYGTHTTSSVN